MSKEQKLKLPEFRLNTDLSNRAGVIDHLFETIETLPLTNAWDVIIQPADETRRAKQNKCLFKWHRQWDMHNHEKPGWAHGSTKLDILLPMKLASDNEKVRKRAEFEKAVLDAVTSREIKIGVAYDLVRSRDIPVRLFADWLTMYKDIAAEQGCHLKSKKDLELEALMVGA